MAWAFQLKSVQMQNPKICHKHSFCLQGFHVGEIWISLGEETISESETLWDGIQLTADPYGQVITAHKEGEKWKCWQNF